MVLGQRRQSFAPSSTTGRPRHVPRKRAQSLVPGDTRQLVPRKSILKASSTFTFTLPSQPNEQQQVSRRAQSVEPSFGSTRDDSESGDEEEGTDSRTDYKAEISDNTSRKSLGRRVSFAPFAQFRVFEINEQNTNSSGGPSSSPAPTSPSNPVESEPQPSPPIPAPTFPKLSNENDYPGRRQSGPGLRRFSTGSGLGEASMSLDIDEDDFSEPPTDPVFFNLDGSESHVFPPSSGVEEDAEERSGDEDDTDMEVTEAIALHINRKRSLSVAEQNDIARRSSLPSRRSSVRFPREPSPPEDDTENLSKAYTNTGEKENEDITTGTQASEGPMEFTIALEKPLKKPRPPSDAWLALQAMANKPEDDDEEEEMELDSAISRLRQARASLDLREENQSGGSYDEASYTSTEDSMEASIEVGEQTLNVTQLMGGVRDMDISGEGDESRSSKVTEDEDFARPIAPVVSTAPLSIQRKENVGSSNTAGKSFPNVFSAPRSQSTSPVDKTPNLEKANVLDNPESESRGKEPGSVPPRLPVFKPATPSRIPVPSPSKARTTTIQTSPSKKRPAPDDVAEDLPQPSPAKKRAVSENLQNERPSQNGQVTSGVPVAPVSTSKPSLSMRRPSGYFAQRRSLAGGAPAPLTNSSVANRQNSEPVEADNGQPLPKKLQMRRTSISVTPRDGNVQDENALSLPRMPLSTKFVSTPEPIQEVSIPEVIITPDDSQTEEAPEDVGDEQNDTLQWRAGVVNEPPPDSDFDVDDDIPSISIEEFFMMTGVKFMDELTIPRRSTIHPSQLQGGRRDSATLPSLAEFVTAMTIHIPQLQLYSWVAKDLQTWIDNSKKIYQEAEDEVAKVTPSLFREFSQANDEGRAELLHQLKLIKANKHSAAKAKWYEWKHQWVDNLLESAERGYTELQQDDQALTELIKEAEDLLPALRRQHAQILEDLKKEQSEVNDLEQSDPGYLEELKAEIEEQNQLLEVYRSDIAESNAKLERLEDKLQELETQKQENITAIEIAQRKITLNKNSTSAEVLRLQNELECLQSLHSCRLSKISAGHVEMIFSEIFKVGVPCQRYRPITSEICISRLEKYESLVRASKRPDPFPLLSELAISGAQAYIRKQPCISAKHVFELLNDFWASTTQIRTQLRYLAVKFPLTLEPLPSESDSRQGFKATASILLHKHKSKALVSFIFDEDILAGWPSQIQQLECEVRIAYGRSVSANEVRDIVMARLSQASVDDSYACLLDSCVEAASSYEQ